MLDRNKLIFFSGITRMELLLDNATFQIYVLHTSGHIQVIQPHSVELVASRR